MLRQLNHLNGRILPDDSGVIDRQGDVRETHTARVDGVLRARDLEHGLHDHREVLRQAAVAEVDVYEGRCVAAEPAWLEADGAAADGPEGAVSRGLHAAAWGRGGVLVGWIGREGGREGELTWVHPLHAIWV